MHNIDCEPYCLFSAITSYPIFKVYTKGTKVQFDNCVKIFRYTDMNRQIEKHKLNLCR